MVIVLTSNRKLSKGGAELQGAAPEKRHTNTQKKEPFGRKIPVPLAEVGDNKKKKKMPSREAVI